MKHCPVSPYLETDGWLYFARMLDKVRRHAAGELRPEYVANIGLYYDARLCHLLGVPHADLAARTLAGGTDREILAWCREHGRAFGDMDRLIWNGFASKRGWRDDATAGLEKEKAASGLAHRADILTYFDYWVADDALPRDPCP